MKYDAGKLRFDLVPPEAEEGIARVLTFGASKYGDRNWEKGLNTTRLYASLRRHLSKWFQGQELDEESGLPELDHVLCNAAMLKWTLANRPEFDDRAKKTKTCPSCYRVGRCSCKGYF